MIHIATVHYKNASWIPIQLKYLRRHVHQPFMVHACCVGVGGNELEDVGKVYHTDFGKEGSVNHSLNLHYLIDRIREVAEPRDLIMFLDGDAFPISDIDPALRMVDCRGMVAIRRDEGPSPWIPHPSFCLATMKYWDSIPGSWADANWVMPDRTIVNDTGSMLYKRMFNKRMNWHKLFRSNVLELHPLFFGLYGDMIYHHGAAFRSYQLPGWGSKDSIHTVDNYTISAHLFKLIQKHDEFYTLFTDGRYMDELKKSLHGHKINVSLRKLKATGNR